MKPGLKMLGLAVLAVSLVAPLVTGQACDSSRTAVIQSDAEAMMGGVLFIRDSGDNNVGCGKPVASMQGYEALRWALDLVNKKDEYLNGEFLTDYYVPGIRLGMQVFEYCGHNDMAVSAVTQMFPSLASDSRSCTDVPSNISLGIIGASTSGATADAANFANKFDIPVVSFQSTAKSLTFSGMYPNFLRTIPPDNDLVEVMAEVLRRLSWNYTVVVYEDTAYGRGAYDALRPALAKEGICLTAAIMADPMDTTQATVEGIVRQVVDTEVVGTIFLGGPTLANAILERASNVPNAGRLQWVFTDSLPLDSSFTSTYARGILSIVPASRYIVEFEDHWVRIDEEDPSPENPWYKEWFMEKYQCNLNGVTGYPRNCRDLFSTDPGQKERDKRLTFVQDQFVEPAVHAVFTYAYALRQAQIAKCGTGSSGICAQLQAMTHEDFLNNYLKNVDFTYAARERVPSLASDQYAPYFAAKKLLYDARGDIVGPSFAVWNYNDAIIGQGSGGFKFRSVGSHINGLLTLATQNMRMYTPDRTQALSYLPTSPCPNGVCSPCLGVPQDMKYMYVDGDIVINGIFSLHQRGAQKFTCGALASTNHPQYLEAMFYAIKQVNAQGVLNTGVRLGGLGIDDCMDSDLSSTFINLVQRGMYTVTDAAGTVLDPRKVEAYTGARDVKLTVPIAGLMDIYTQPLVGYQATSPQLDRFKYYLSAVPGMEDEFRAIILILQNYGWDKTQVVFSRDWYGDDAVNLFRRLAAQAGICVVAAFDIEESREGLVGMLRYHSNVQPTVLLLSSPQYRNFFRILSNYGSTGGFVYIATAALGNDPAPARGYENVAQGVLTLNLPLSPLTSFFADLNQRRVNPYSAVNPWFTEWYEALHNCSVSGDLGMYPIQCPNLDTTGVMDAPSSFEEYYRVGHVINAVYAIARGLDMLLERHCQANYNSVCGAFASLSPVTKGDQLLEMIMQATFPIEDYPAPGRTFSFDGKSARLAYDIYNYQPNGFVSVGNVNPFANTVTVSSGVRLHGDVSPTSVQNACPQPCIECLYMFSYQQFWYIDGDLLIPAVFDVHFRDSTESIFSCGDLRTMNGVQYTEAFKYMLDFVNSGNAPGIRFNNVRLGGVAFDGCSNAARSSAIINGVMGRTFPVLDNNNMMVDPSRFISWMTYGSESTMEAADLLKMIGMPIVTPGATAPQLLDKVRYSTFFRTIPSGAMIARAMADLVIEMGWKYVITLNAPEAGSRESRDLFRQYLQDNGICVIAAYEFETDGSSEIILGSIASSSTDVVAVFSEADMYIPDLLRTKDALPDISGDLRRIVFVSNNFWDLGRVEGLSRNSDAAYNALSFRMTDTAVPPFIAYLESQTLAGSSNPWLPEYYQALFRCDLGANRRYTTRCGASPLGQAVQPQRLDQDVYTLTTINAVHALALALNQTLVAKCGDNYSGVCSQFLTDSDTLSDLMQRMDAETFTDLAGQFFDFIEREVQREFDVMRHDNQGLATPVGVLSRQGDLTLTNVRPDDAQYRDVRSQCPEDCLVCEGLIANFRNFSYIDGDVYIVGLFDVHEKGGTPFSCGQINDRQGLQLLEAFNYAVTYMNDKKGIFGGKFRGVRIGAIGLDVCNSPARAANLVANIHNGNVVLNLPGGRAVSPQQILAYVGPYDTQTTIRVADILSAIEVPQITYGATGLGLQDAVKYDYLLRSVPADDKQARAIISYLKYYNLTNVQVVTSFETIGLEMTQEFMRLAELNLVCITENYTTGESGVITDADARQVVTSVVGNPKSKVVILLVHNPLPILKAAGDSVFADDEILWVATDKWGFDQEYLTQLDTLLGDRSRRDNVIIFDIDTADVPGLDDYLEDKTPANNAADPWYQEYYEFLFSCDWGSAGSCDATRGISRAENYIQDPYALYVINAVFSAGMGIDHALKLVCDDTTTTGYDGLCLKFQATGYRRDFVFQGMKETRFQDDTMQPFYYEPTGESIRGYHIYNVTANTDRIGPYKYMYENVGSYNDTHFLKLDITYDIFYVAQCTPYVDCSCPFKEPVPSRYMAQPSPSELNLVYFGDIHEPHPTNKFGCSNIKVGADFFKMIAFFYAINRVNTNRDQRYRDSLRLGGVAVDTCSSTLRLDQDIFNLLSGFPLCDTDDKVQVIPPSSIVAFVPDGNTNAVPISNILAPAGITSVSPTATSPALRDWFMSQRFLSIVPPDDLQAAVIIKMMETLQWDYGSVIYTEEPTMIAAKNQLLAQAETARSACFGQALGLPLTASVADAEDRLERVSQQVGARAVVLFTLPAHTRLLMQAAKNKGLSGRFVWIGTSAWGESSDEVLKDLEQEATGAIILQPHSVAVEEFRDYVKSLTYNNRRGIPDDWFEELYQTLHQCTIREAVRPLPFPNLCSKTETVTDAMVPSDPSVLHTIIAVYMVAEGLNNIPNCDQSQTQTFDISACLTNLNDNRNREIYQSILNAQYNVLPDLLGDESFSFTFDSSGYGNIGFDILNYRIDPAGTGYIYTNLGRYASGRLSLVTRNYVGMFDDGVVPNSNCAGTECRCAGPYGGMQGGVSTDWRFVPRQASVQVTEEGRTYLDPSTGELFYVEKIPDVTSRFSDMWGVAVATLAAIGVFVSLALFIYLLVVYPVRGGTSVLGFVLSFGIILLYALVFAFVAHVNVELCGLRRFCLGFCYAICYSALFVKLVDCWRSREKEDMFEVKYNKLGRPLGLFMVTVLLILVQVIINAEWLILEPPGVERIFYNSQYWPRCTPNDFYDEGLVLSLCYIMVLILLTICLGFCTFNNTKNHREARWILGMAVLAVPTWVVWCSWATLGALKTRDAAVAVGLLINATVLLLLGPIRKLYLLNKYTALIEEQDRQDIRDAKSQRGSEYGGVYDNQYDNAPRLHDGASNVGSTRGFRYPPSSIGRSGR